MSNSNSFGKTVKCGNDALQVRATVWGDITSVTISSGPISLHLDSYEAHLLCCALMEVVEQSTARRNEMEGAA